MVRKLKTRPGVDNPWAVAWSMKGSGAEHHPKKKKGKKEAVGMSGLGFVTRGDKRVESLRESVAAPIRIIEAAEPAAADKAREGRVFRVLLITEGMSGNGVNYYGPEAIASCVEAFEGKPAFIDHPSKTEEVDLPERSVHAKCGYYKGVRVVQLPEGGTGAEAELHTDLSEAGQFAAEKCLTAIHYKDEFPDGSGEYVGLSINAKGEGVERMVETAEGETVKAQYITRIVPSVHNSTDIVTVAARGGRVIECLESLSERGGRMPKVIVETLKAAANALKGARESKEPKDIAARLVEAEKALEKAVKESEGEGEGGHDFMARREGESEDEHKARLGEMYAALKKHVGEGEDEGEDHDGDGDGDGDHDELHIRGRGAVDKVLKREESLRRETVEARRVAIEAMIKEANLPAKLFNLDAMAKHPLAESRAEIARVKALRETLAADGDERVSALVGEKLKESEKGPARNQGVFAGCKR